MRAQYIRVMFDEITRILNHLLWLGAHALDVGAMTVFLYCFREREDLMDVLRGGVGRAHARGVLPAGRRLPRPAGHACRNTRRRRITATPRTLERAEREPPGLAARLHRGLHAAAFRSYVDDYETLLTDNRIWKQRTVGIGVVSPERALALGFTGPMLRGSGRRRGTCARSSRTRSTTGWSSTSRSASTATATTATWCASRRCASRTASSSSASTGCARTRAR